MIPFCISCTYFRQIFRNIIMNSNIRFSYFFPCVFYGSIQIVFFLFITLFMRVSIYVENKKGYTICVLCLFVKHSVVRQQVDYRHCFYLIIVLISFFARQEYTYHSLSKTNVVVRLTLFSCLPQTFVHS